MFIRLLWWLFVGSAGTRTRLEVLLVVREQPGDAQQLALLLNVNSTKTRRHLDALTNRHIQTMCKKYVKPYFASEVMESNLKVHEPILEETWRNKR